MSDDAVVGRKMRKEYGKLVAVDDLDIALPKGLLYGLIGPNGSGKTTTIKMLVGLLSFTKGEAYLLGEKVPVRKKLPLVGYMPQELAIYTDITLHENLELFANLYSMERGDFLRREKELLSMIDLAERKDSVVSQLSGGMKHRTSLACALIHDPELLFLDEPTVGVDPELRVGFWKYFSELKSRGKTVLLTTHYMDEAVRCDVVGMMRAGKLIAEGPPRTLMSEAGVGDLESAFLEFSKRAVA
ncbi:MAG: ABC transporter ATP-binding protein [Euryarchaeota archaeon RBG_19FT_COMBO_56_21]|nr:MAG: ABC transporter ATP-binding protein [Euryarchaeota archaeon RBG_19FT_COMBO_56_21]